MIKNYIKIDDLIIKEPRLQEWESINAVIKSHIRDAFQRTCIELQHHNPGLITGKLESGLQPGSGSCSAVGIDIRKVMVPLFLNSGGSITAPAVGNWVKSDCKNRIKRFVVRLAKSGTGTEHQLAGCKFILEASADGEQACGEPAEICFGITTAENFDVSAEGGFEELTIVFFNEHQFYRYRVECETGVTAKCDIFLVDTDFDDLIVFKALQNFFTAKYRKNDDSFASKMNLYEKKFNDEITSLIYSYNIRSAHRSNETAINSGSKIVRIVL